MQRALETEPKKQFLNLAYGRYTTARRDSLWGKNTQL